jgi:predicted alpha/beta superfamily hydrolase
MFLDASPQALSKDLHLLEGIRSEKLGNQRDVLVWLPPSYYAHPDRRFPTLFLQDGQAVFDGDPRFGGTKAGADSWAAKLIAERAIAEVILIAVDSSANRDQEYSPAIRGQAYLEFITNELKPRIDEQYRTLPGPENTGNGGWSLGAFISLYAAWQRPDVFGSAACLSTCFFD